MLRWIASVVVGLSIVLIAPASLAKKSVRKVQEVDFDEMSLKGTVRNPDGAYLVQKKGLRFLPLHEVKKDLDRRIRETSFYVR
jgi:hypothetical protein